MAKRASLKELFEFCNELRAAGGGERLSALLPGVPSQSQSCLVAANLNFDCAVAPEEGEQWYMTIQDGFCDGIKKGEDIAKKLSLPIRSNKFCTCNICKDTPATSISIMLPAKIGAVAAAYDRMWDNALVAEAEWRLTKNKQILALLEEYWPLVEDKIKEQSSISRFVTKKGTPRARPLPA